MNILHSIKHNFKAGNALTRILFINIGVFLLLNVIPVITWIFSGGTQNYSISNFFIENFQSYINVKFLIFKPWTIITYMFTHLNLGHLFFNMLWLYWMGRIFIDLLNGTRFVAIYLLGGAAGLLLTIIAFYSLPQLSHQLQSGAPIIGASAAVTAILAATATYVPNYTVHLMFIGKVKLKYIALAMIILDFLVLPSSSNSGGHIAHIGGAIFGFAWAYQIKTKNRDISKWFLTLMVNMENWYNSNFSTYKNTKSFNNSRPFSNSKSYTKKTYSPPHEKNSPSQSEIDAILDKIAKSGYESLTAQEKEKLFSSSNKK